MELSKNQIVRLSKYDQMLIQIALTRKATNPTPTKLKDLQNIYRDITGSKECYSCSKNWLIRMAKWYVNSSVKNNSCSNNSGTHNEDTDHLSNTVHKKTQKVRKPRVRKANTKKKI